MITVLGGSASRPAEAATFVHMADRTGQKLSVGVVLDEGGTCAWHREALAGIGATPGVHCLAVVQLSSSQGRLGFWGRMLRKVMARRSAGASMLRPIPEDEAGQGTLSSRYHWPEGLDAPDVLVHLGNAIPPSSLLARPQKGFWHLGTSPPDGSAWLPPAHRAMLEGEEFTRIMLSRHVPGSQQWEVVREAVLPTRKAMAHVDDLLRTMSAWLGQELMALMQGSARQASYTVGPSHPVRRPGPAMVMRACSMSKPTEKAYSAVQRNIGILYHPIHALLDPSPNTNVRWMPSPAEGGGRSAPFGYRSADGTLHVLYAKHGRSSGEHGIARIRPKRDNVLKRSRLLFAGEALGYPYTFIHEGQVLTVVEERGSSHVRLFRMNENAQRLEPTAVLLDHALCSPTLFQHDGNWWLMGTMPPFEDEALYLFMARSITGPFVQHPLSPALFNASGARPAGTPFMHEGSLYRPALELGAHGMERIAIKRILRLDAEGFEEETVKLVSPIQGSTWSHGIRTLCSVGDVTLVDGRRALPGMVRIKEGGKEERKERRKR